MLPIGDLAHLSPAHAVAWFFANFFGAYLISKYAGPAVRALRLSRSRD